MTLIAPSPVLATYGAAAEFDDHVNETPDHVNDGDTASAKTYRQQPEDAGDQPDERAPIPGGGLLLEEPSEPKVFKLIDKGVRSNDRLDRNRYEIAKHWEQIRRGVQFAILEKSEDANVYRAVLPPGVDDTYQPVPNKVLDLSNKQVSQILVDPPLADPKPDSDSDKNRNAMDLAKRYLRSDGDASGTNDAALWRECLTMNRTRGSAFVFVWIDPTAGGWRPMQMMAHPQATDPANALMGPKIDPKTKQAVVGPDGEPILERTTDPVLRYVADVDGREVFTENAAEAKREWLPRIRRMVITPNQVRTFPHTATVFEAHSITLLLWETLGAAKVRFPFLQTLGDKQLRELCRWRPKRWKNIVPEAMQPANSTDDGEGEANDQTLFFWYHHFCRHRPDYPDGAEVAVNGGTLNDRTGVVLRRDTLREDVQTEDGTTVPVLMEPPVSQFRAYIDTDRSDPFGMAPVSMYGGANEIRAHIYMGVLDDLDVRLRPNTYLTWNSNLTREDINRRDGTPLEVMSKDDMPIFEQRPQLSPATMPMLERVEHDMDTLANLNQTAQALDSPYSESGVSKQVSISQAKVQLAQDWQGFNDGATQYWKIKLQLAQARLKTPTLVKIGGENSSFKARHFVGADMIGVSAVTFAPGSGTMMSPAEKAQHLQVGQNNGWLEKETAGELYRSSMSDSLGLSPSPHEEHMDRCVADWIEGPPAGWEEQFAETQSFPQRQQEYQARLAAATQQLVAAFASRGMDPQAAQMAAQQQATQQVGPAPVQPPPLYTPFEPRPNDEEPVVAKVRYLKFSKLLSTIEYKRQSPAWRTLVDEGYTAAAYAAGIQTVRQQQAAQQAAQQQNTPDKNAPPQWSDFLASVTKSVVSKAQQLVAAEVAAIGSSTTVEQKPSAEKVPAVLGMQNDAAEAEKDRQHERTMQADKHAQDIEKIGVQQAAKAVADAGKPAPTGSRQGGPPNGQ